LDAATAGVVFVFSTAAVPTVTFLNVSSSTSNAASTSNINIEKDASVTGDVIVKFGTASLTGAEGAAVDGDLLAAAGDATVAEELTFKNVTVGTAAVEKTNTTPAVAPAVEAFANVTVPSSV